LIQLKELIQAIDNGINAEALLNKLVFGGLIEKECEYYKINIEE
jgi:hypothetical protein